MELGPGPLSPQATGDRALVTLLKLVMLKLSEWSSVHPSSTSAFPSSFLSIAIGKHQLNPACGLKVTSRPLEAMDHLENLRKDMDISLINISHTLLRGS